MVCRLDVVCQASLSEAGPGGVVGARNGYRAWNHLVSAVSDPSRRPGRPVRHNLPSDDRSRSCDLRVGPSREIWRSDARNGSPGRFDVATGPIPTTLFRIRGPRCRRLRASRCVGGVWTLRPSVDLDAQ